MLIRNSRNNWLSFLLITSILLSGCAPTSASQTDDITATEPKPGSESATPSFLPSPSPTRGAMLVRPGIYIAESTSMLPLPTDGYRLFVIGEIHGIYEVRKLTIEYLQLLHESIGLRDLILELGPAFEGSANDYINEETNTLVPSLCLYADILEGVRSLNQSYSKNERIRVHFVDVDYPLSAIYSHIRNIKERLGNTGEALVIPPLVEFLDWPESEMLALVDSIANAPGPVSIAITMELKTIRDSIRWYFLVVPSGDVLLSPPPEARAIREARIAQNIQNTLNDLGNAPVLALCGAGHAQKTLGTQEFGQEPWAQRLSESGVPIHAIFATGMYGTAFWRGKTSHWGTHQDQILLPPPDGISLEVVLDEAPNYHVVYIDLRLDTTASILLPWQSDQKAGKLYDGIILFKEMSPMENACP